MPCRSVDAAISKKSIWNNHALEYMERIEWLALLQSTVIFAPGRWHFAPRHTSRFQLLLPMPPADGALFPREEGEIQPCANLCPICARALLVWTFWRIW